MHRGDTSPEAAEAQLKVFRRMTGEQRLKIALEMSDFAREVSLSRIRAEHSDWSSGRSSVNCCAWTSSPIPSHPDFRDYRGVATLLRGGTLVPANLRSTRRSRYMKELGE